VLSAELELGLLWSLKQVAEIEIAPVIPNSASRPDAFSANLFPRAPAYVEITALSDDTFSGQVAMTRTANIISQFSERLRKGSSKHLYFEFQEHRYYDNGRYHRVRGVSGNFQLAPPLEAALNDWLKASDWPSPPAIRLTDNQTDVVIRWKEKVHPLSRTFTSMPAVATHVEDNPIFKRLRKKERQLSGIPAGSLKCIFLGDAGCRMLRELKPLGPTDVSGDQTIRHFLARSSVDIVCVFSPYRSLEMFRGFSPPQWKVSLYERVQQSPGEYARINRLATCIPKPQLEGYQARSWHEQGNFNPQGRGIYLGCRMTTQSSSLSISISARMVLELLAGRLTQEQFHNFLFGENQNQFDHELRLGMTIQAARIDKGGLDEDDDHLVFDFELDSGAAALKKPESKP
jgi:hypothetical protein